MMRPVAISGPCGKHPPVLLERKFEAAVPANASTFQAGWLGGQLLNEMAGLKGQRSQPKAGNEADQGLTAVSALQASMSGLTS